MAAWPARRAGLHGEGGGLHRERACMAGGSAQQTGPHGERVRTAGRSALLNMQSVKDKFELFVTM
jgi:hypothetical protein